MRHWQPIETTNEQHAHMIERFVANRGGSLKPTALDRALLAGAAALRASQGWQSIETAPKDGTRLLLFSLAYMKRWNVWGIGHYFRGVTGDGEGWIAHSFHSQPDTLSGGFEPTHWMPLPPPPVASVTPFRRQA